jgi:hypothetical protein
MFTIVYEFLTKQIKTAGCFVENYLYDLGYDVMIGYSKLQIFLDPYYKAGKEYIVKKYNEIFLFPSKEEMDIEFIKNGRPIFSCFQKHLESNEIMVIPYDYDFIVYTNSTNKIVYKKLPTVFLYNMCDIKFFFIEFQYNDETTRYPIQLKTDTYNYYVVRNVIHYDFMDYFLQKHYPKIYDEDKLQRGYTLEVLDHTVSKLIIDENRSIRFLESGYSLEES